MDLASAEELSVQLKSRQTDAKFTASARLRVNSASVFVVLLFVVDSSLRHRHGQKCDDTYTSFGRSLFLFHRGSFCMSRPIFLL